MQHDNVTTPIRRLNNLGLKIFDEWLSTKGDDNKTSAAPPREIYFSAETSEAVDGVGSVPLAVADKMTMAVAVNRALGDRRQALTYDEGLWSGLCLLWADAILPEFKGKRLIKNKSNYLMPSIEEMREKGLGYRHRVWGPCYMESRFGREARVFLAKDISTLTDGMDALIYYNQAYLSVAQAVDALYMTVDMDALIYYNQAYLSVAQAVDALYMTVDGEFMGDGNVLDDHQKAMNLRKGEIRDFIEHCRQIGYTHSLAHVSPEVLINSANKLEFGPQLDNARRRRQANDLPWVAVQAAAAA